MSLMRIIFTILALLIIKSTHSQVLDIKEYDKTIALYEAKKYIVNHILAIDSTTLKFKARALAASSSRELTTVIYKCNSQKKMGLLLAFFNKTVSKNGFKYTKYSFKNLAWDKALKLFDKIYDEIENNRNYLMNKSFRNIYFLYEDLRIMIYHESENIRIRIFWKEFDSEWQNVAFMRTLRRFEKEMN